MKITLTREVETSGEEIWGIRINGGHIKAFVGKCAEDRARAAFVQLKESNSLAKPETVIETFECEDRTEEERLSLNGKLLA